MTRSELWPALPLSEWQDTYTTLHMWTQIMGKIRMTLSAPLNHWWHVTLYVSATGLRTGPIPYPGGVFELSFNFLKHELDIVTSEGGAVTLPLRAESVAAFYTATMNALGTLGIAVDILTKPQEVPEPIPFDQDLSHCSYDPAAAQRFWRILVSSAKVFDRFRSNFIGKYSPTHFFWGSFDLASTRFSGRRAPARKGAISGPAYSHEEWSAGFWPGGGAVPGPAYYAYVVPKPEGLEGAAVRPAAARWNAELGEFVLMYDDVRAAESPEDALYAFLESTYDAGATLGKWDRAALEV
jgi:hypothetical protein